ncbi:MAG: rane protein [Panacagrimonas sp.]|jgi:hypothetical protein|nr:hypothetical protein [Panacagrimonas sp.]MCC2658093.1 rane protein [Panacagrimonas sp.]
MPPRTLQLPEEPDFHRRAWRMQRIACGVLAAIVLAALLGAFGGGPLSRAQSGDAHGLSIAYQRFARAEARTTLDLHYAAGPATTRELVLGRAWIDDMREIRITPAPSAVHPQADAIRYRFAVQDSAPLHVRIEAEPIGPGPVELRVGQLDAAPIRVNQLVFP